MYAHKLSLTALSLGAALLFGTPAKSADLPKEGTFSGMYAGAVMFKLYPVGKERAVSTFEDNSLTVGKGFLDHTTWHCLSVGSTMTGMQQFNGYCVVTDPSGDQIVADIASDGTYPADAKVIPAKGMFTSGTGKYTGISGNLTNILHGPDFRSAEAGVFAAYGDFQASYKLP
jgi:hypothetical protein